MSIVKNNGEVEILTKLAEYDIIKMRTSLRRAMKKLIKKGSAEELDSVIQKVISKTVGIEYVKG